MDPKIETNDSQRLKMIETLSLASGSSGMAGGQAIDLASVGLELNIDELENMHSHKTGALIKASAEIGALSAKDISSELFISISNYAKYIGIAFQIKDDILDIESDTAVLGKPQGSDIALNKPTYPNLLGLDGAKKMADNFLRYLTDYFKNKLLYLFAVLNKIFMQLIEDKIQFKYINKDVI